MEPSRYHEKNRAQAEGTCRSVQMEFSSYLDCELSGVKMGRMAEHLEQCSDCSEEFREWRSVQATLSELGPAKAPIGLQARLRMALAAERERNSYLPVRARVVLLWHNSFAPLALQGAGGLIAAALLLGGLFRLFGPGVAVQANDDDMAHLIGPHYLYSQVLPKAIETGRDVPVLVEAKVDTNGRVYDYTIVSGPDSPTVRLRVEENLLSSVFQPATVFGVPVDGDVMLTYMGVSVHG